MKRTALLRRTPLRRRGWMKRSQKRTTYAKRPRDVQYMRWVRRQPCAVARFARFVWDQGNPLPYVHYPCTGRVQADHGGIGRGLSHKAPDGTCIPMCEQHHLERTSFTGFFATYNQEQMRSWTAQQIEHYQQRYRG